MRSKLWMRPRLLVALVAPLCVAAIGAGSASAVTGGSTPTSPPLSFRWASGYGVASSAAAPETCTSGCQPGTSTQAAGGFASPEGVVALGSGSSERVLVADTANNRIDVLDSNGEFVEAVGSGVSDGGSGFETCTTAGGCLQGSYGVGPGQMEGPEGLAADTSGHLYVSDAGNARIDEFSVSGDTISFVRAFGIGVVSGAGGLETCTTTCRGGTASGDAGGLDGPFGLALDGSGHLYVADAFNDRVDEFDVSSSTASFVRAWGWGVAGNGAFGACTAACSTGTNGAGAAGGLDTPEGVAVDPTSGDVVVADSEQNRVQVFTSSGGFVRAFGVGVSDGSATTAETCTATCQASQGGTGAGGMASPNDVLVTAAGDVLVADTLNSRIDAFRLSDGAFEAGWGYAVSGGGFPQFESCTTSCVSGGTNGADGALNLPDGLALDSTGTLFVADRQDNRVNAYDMGSATTTTTTSSSSSTTTTATTTTTTTTTSSSSTSSGTAPVATTMQPSFVSSTQINLVGSIASSTGDTRYYFQWGPDLYHMPNDVPASPRDIGTGVPYTATETITGLAPNTTYCFRLVAENAFGTTYAHDAGSGDPGTNRGLCAQTSGPPIAPHASTGDSAPFSSADHPTGTAENLSGTVNPENQPTTWWFQYSIYSDLSGAGGGQPANVAGEVPARAPGASLPQVNTSDDPVSTLLTGLTPGKRYYYRLVARNSTGTTYDDTPYGGSPHRSFVAYPGAPLVFGGFQDTSGNAIDGGTLQEHDSARFYWYCTTAVAGNRGVGKCNVSGAFSSNVASGAVALTTDQPGQHTIRVDETSASGATASKSFTYTVKAPPAPTSVKGSVQQDANAAAVAAANQAANAGLCTYVYSVGAKAGVYCPATAGTLGGMLYAESGYNVVSGPMKVGSGGGLISDKGLGVIAAGSGNVIAAGAGNVIAAGSGNVIAAGAGNVVVLMPSGLVHVESNSLISDKGLGVIAAGAGNFATGNEANLVSAAQSTVIAAGAGNVIAAGAGNVIAAGAGNIIMAALGTASLAQTANTVAALTSVSSLIPGNLNGFVSASGGAVINAGAYNAGDTSTASSASPLATAARTTRASRTVVLATGRVTFLHGGERLGLLLLWTKTGRKVIARLQSENALRRKHHRRLISLKVTMGETFTPKGHGKTVRVRKTFTITPGQHAVKKKK